MDGVGDRVRGRMDEWCQWEGMGRDGDGDGEGRLFYSILGREKFKV